MQTKIKILSIALIAFLFSAFSTYSYAWSESNDDDNVDASASFAYYNNSYSPGNPDDFSPEDAPMQRTVHELYHAPRRVSGHSSLSARLPGKISAGEKIIVVDPRVHAWGAYAANGTLLRSGLASAGSKWCDDIGRPCRTRTGVFHIISLGSRDCVSNLYPVDRGGAPMPYCMYFNGAQALHGSHELAEANISHGCVRISVMDAEWLRFNFAHVGTKVVIRPY